jgi:hypothetical protein
MTGITGDMSEITVKASIQKISGDTDIDKI